MQYSFMLTSLFFLYCFHPKKIFRQFLKNLRLGPWLFIRSSNQLLSTSNVESYAEKKQSFLSKFFRFPCCCQSLRLNADVINAFAKGRQSSLAILLPILIGNVVDNPHWQCCCQSSLAMLLPILKVKW